MESKEPQNKKEKALNEAVDILAQIFVDLLDNRKLLDDNIHKYHYDGERKREK